MSVTVRSRSQPIRGGALPRVTVSAIGGVLAVAVICTVPLLLYIPFFTEPLMRDEGFYAAVAQIIERGGVPYRDAFDNKPPMIFLWYLASFQLFGQNIMAPRLLAALAMSGTTLLVYFQARLMYTHRAACFAALAFALLTGVALFETNANVEYFLLLPTVGALLTFTLGEKRGGIGWYLATGVLAGISFMTKETTMFTFILFYAVVAIRQPGDSRLAFLRSRDFWRKSIAMSVAFAATQVAFFLPFLWVGAGQDYIDAVVIYTFKYVGAGESTWIKIRDFTASPLLIAYVLGPWFIASTAGIWVYWKHKASFEGRLVVAWYAASFVGIVAAGRFFAHYYVLLFPALGLLVPAGAEYLRDSIRTIRWRVAFLTILLFSSVAPVASSAAIYFHDDPGDRHTQKFFDHPRSEWETQSPLLAAWINERTGPGDYIYNTGFQSEVYFLTGLPSPTRFLFTYPFQLDNSFELDAIEDLKANMPKYIFSSELDQPPVDRAAGAYYPYEMQQFIDRNYDYIGRVYYANVWQLRGTTPVEDPNSLPSQWDLE